MSAHPVKVVVLDDYQRVARSMADWSSSPVPLEVDFVHEHIADDDALVRRIGDAEIIVVMRERTPLPARATSRLPSLRLIVTTGMRNASVEPIEGVTLCGTPALTTPTVELTWALILGHRRRIVQESASLDAGSWQVGIGDSLEGSTIGLIGLGNIGARVARVAAAFDMRVLAWSQNLTAERARESGATAVSLDELLAESDIVSVHTRLSDRTRGLIGADEFAKMKDTALFVNTSRAEITDEVALSAALRDGAIGGAALDVYTREPLPADSPLRGIPTALRTPHLGYVTRQNYDIFYRGALEAIVAFLQGEPIRVIAD